MTALKQKLLEVFAVEYREHLDAIRQMLSEGGGPRDAAALAEATRRAHSLKGAARAVGLKAVEDLAHRLESLFIDAGKGERSIDSDVRHFLVDTLDEIEDKAAAGTTPNGGGTAPSAASPVAEKDKPRPAPVESASIRIDAQNLDRLLRSAGELHADAAFHEAMSSEIDRLSRQVRGLEARWTKLRKPATSRRSALLQVANGDEVQVELRAVANGLRAAARRHDRGVRSMARHLADLERHVKAARMLPAESVFGSFRKMVRDLAASEGREVDVEVTGLDCQADRLVLQRIKDPVMHMLTNAVSHGIEPAEDREARGKPAAGRVALRLREKEGRLIVVVEDDGRGIDFTKVATRAVAEGRIRTADASATSHDALLPLLFEPGFSTADAVTTVSGRGVGLSVVREAVTALQGTIDVQSAPGRGAKITLSLPVNILSRRLLVVGFRDALYALPTEAVVRVLRVAPADLVTVAGRPAVRRAESALPLVSIGEILGVEDPAATPGTFGANVVIVRTGGGHIGAAGALAIAVDRLVGVSEFIVRPLDIGGDGHRRWSGVVATDDGTPCLLLNPAGFAGSGFSPAATVLRQDTGTTRSEKVVLVVDDSITTRTLEKSILEAHGYRVRLSVDGREALAEVRRERPDVVVSDVEMPHVDGFELVRAMKAERSLADIPVILVTSRAADVDRERGLRLGADAYVVKQKFDQAELLETIRQMV